MEAVWISAAVVAIAEIGDKTQLLAILLAARFRKPIPIVIGIFAATLLNHAAAASGGYFISQWLTGRVFQMVVGIVFIIMAGWALIPGKEDEDASRRSQGGVFLTTLIGMMLANVPEVFFGEAVTKIVPLEYVRRAAAILFALIGLSIVAGALHAT